MGAVWRARNVALDVPVALKLIRSTSNREVLQNRLLQEARAAAKLGHPAIVRVFDVGKTEHGDPFIVMELLQGESLGSVIATTGRIAATRAVQLLLPIADALSMAHAKRIVHRDLKPDNVFICKGDGQIQPKLVDFGIAKLDKGEGTFTTQAGAVVGSPEYMSPEQARGEDDLDLRTDVWSFCVVLYEALTGQIPFKAANYHALLLMIVESTPPTIQSLAAGDAELSAIIERGMSKNREQRWGSMRELGRALADWLLAQGIREDACGVSLESKWGFEAVPSGIRGSGIVPSGASTMPPPSVLTAPRWTRSLFAKYRGRSRQVYAAVGALALLVVVTAVVIKQSTVSQLGNSAPIASLSGASAAEAPLGNPCVGCGARSLFVD